MFTTLINWFVSLWNVIKTIWQSVWNFVRGGWTWLIGIIYAIILMGQQLGDWVSTQIDFLSGLAGQLFSGQNSNFATGSVGNIFSFANAFFPLQEAFVLFEAYAILAMACITYRFIKSWIPTLS
jgi:uncharacterized membrane protein